MSWIVRVPQACGRRTLNYFLKRHYSGQIIPGRPLKRCSPMFVVLALPVAYWSVPTLRAAAKVRTTRRLDSSEITRTLHRFEEVQDPGRAMSLLRYLRDDVGGLVLAVCLAMCVAYYNTQIPLAIGALTSALTSLDSRETFLSVIRSPALHLLKCYCVHASGTALYISILSGIGERFASRIRLALFRSLVFKDMSFYDSHKVGELINRLTGDVQEVKSSFKQIVSLGIRNTIQVAGCCISLYSISPAMTSLLFGSAALLTTLGSVAGSLLRAASRHAQDQVANSTSFAEEVLGNLVTVKSFATEEEEVVKYEESLASAASAYSTLGVGIGVFTALSALATNGMMLQTLFYGGYQLSSGNVTPGDVMAFLASAQVVQRSLTNMSVLISQMVKGSTAAARVAQYLDDGARRREGEVILESEGRITLTDVTFSYPSRAGVTVLKNLNLEIKPGQTVALCGASGTGKSTVGSLLERFYGTDQGQIWLDNHDINSLDTKWLRGSYLGYISQEPVLFATTIKDNIRYGAPRASDAEIERAARAANAHDFISDFPEGYDTMVGERGTTLSGGQKQRIAIARALLKNPTVLILDEATSALDASSERLVSDALQHLCENRTVLVIAHRLSTVRNADCIVVLDKGQVAEKGTHDELILKEGAYFNLVKNQTNLESSYS